MIVGWSPSSPSVVAASTYLGDGVNPSGPIARADVNSLLRDLDVEIPRRLISGAMFDMKSLGVTTAARSPTSVDRGVTYLSVGSDIYRHDPFLGAVDTGLNLGHGATVAGSTKLAEGQIMFWSGSATTPGNTATLLHTGYSAVSTIANDAVQGTEPRDYDYDATYGRYYRLCFVSGSYRVQHALTANAATWTQIGSNNSRGFALSKNFPYLVLVRGATDIVIEVYLDTTLIRTSTQTFVGALATYTSAWRCAFFQDRLYIQAQNNAASNWCILRSKKAGGLTDLSVNLVDLEIVYEGTGAAASVQYGFETSRNLIGIRQASSPNDLVWSADGKIWSRTGIGAESKLTGDQLFTTQSVSRWL